MSYSKLKSATQNPKLFHKIELYTLLHTCTVICPDNAISALCNTVCCQADMPFSRAGYAFQRADTRAGYAPVVASHLAIKQQ